MHYTNGLYGDAVAVKISQILLLLFFAAEGKGCGDQCI